MADPISIFVRPVIEKCIDEAVNFSKGKYASIAGVKKECQNLGDKLAAIKAVLKDAEDRHEQLADEAVKNWLAKLIDAACDGEDIVDDFRTEACLWKMRKKLQQVYLTLRRIRNKSRAAKDIKRISDRLERISQNKKDYTIGFGTHLVHHPVTDDGDSSRLADHVVGREEDKAKIIEMLRPVTEIEGTVVEDFSVIPIIGMGGVGKSTLCRLVIQDESVIRHFDGLIIWVRVTEVFDRQRIFNEIECQFKGSRQTDNSLSLNQLEESIQNFLAGTRRFLLVLDDVWTENYQDWESLRRVLNGGAGSKVMITSRSGRVAEKIGTKEPYVVNCLGDEESRSLFQYVAYKGHPLPPPHVREAMEREIVKMCDGLPLALKAMGARLKGPDMVKKWNKICEHDIWEIEKQPADKDNMQVLPKLRRSYRYLLSHLKQCFAYCSMFPKGYVFDKKELVKLWMAEGFVVKNDEGELPENSGQDYFDELLSHSFFQPANVDDNNKYRMHNLMHDLALSLSSPYCSQVKGNRADRIPDESRHLSLLCDNNEDSIKKVTEKSSPNKLRTLLLHTESSKNIPNDVLERMFQSMRRMRVINLSSCTLQVVPESIQKMKLLRYLNLSKTGIKELPNSVCTLYNLQILILLGCKELSNLPDKFHNLVNLQHLDLDDEFWDNISDLPPKIGDLTILQNLCKFIVGKKRGHGIEELKKMSSLSGTLHIVKLENAAKATEADLDKKERLEKLILEWKDKDPKLKDNTVYEKTLKELKPHENLKELDIVNYRGSKFPHWITEQKFMVVCLKHCDKVIHLGPLPCLQELNIEGMQNLEKWEEDECPQLAQLRISSCPKLHSLPSIFPKLTDMEITKCDSLDALPSTPSLKQLTLDNTSRLDDWKKKNPAIADSCHVELKVSNGEGGNETLSASETRSRAAAP